MRGNKLERVSAVLVMAFLSGSVAPHAAQAASASARGHAGELRPAFAQAASGREGAPAPDARSYAGRWEAVAVANGVDVPFVL